MINKPRLQTGTADGFTIVELLLALALTGLLLAAVAVAFNASVINYRENEDIFKAVNSARQALYRITRQLRDANSVDPNAPLTECALFTADNENITYRYDSLDDTLYLDDASSNSSYVLCDGVSAASFEKYTNDTDTCVKSVVISITVDSGGISQTLSAAAAIRRNLD